MTDNKEMFTADAPPRRPHNRRWAAGDWVVFAFALVGVMAVVFFAMYRIGEKV